jgi:hypothetical protein
LYLFLPAAKKGYRFYPLRVPGWSFFSAAAAANKPENKIKMSF